MSAFVLPAAAAPHTPGVLRHNGALPPVACAVSSREEGGSPAVRKRPPDADSTEIHGVCHEKNAHWQTHLSHSLTIEKTNIILDIATTYRYTFAQCGMKWDGVERLIVHVPRKL
jgi:hypothetical protein